MAALSLRLRELHRQLGPNGIAAYIERLGLPKADTDKILHHNAQALFGFAH